MSEKSPETGRILGDQRIFQSVFNDLKAIQHQMVTLPDGTKAYAYTYEGIDPYELEDSSFPQTVALIKARDELREREAVRMLAVALHEAGGEIFVSKRSFEASNTDDVVNREDLPYGIRFYLTKSPKKKGSE